MRACTIAVGALLTFAGPALAEPAKRDAPKPGLEQKPASAVVLASADTVRTPPPASSKAIPAPVKRVAPRVTTCRCGDPQAGPENPEQ